MKLPEPEAGLVISYSYLWRHEAEKGQLEGRKNRPCAIIIVQRQEKSEKIVTVVPITHTPPLISTNAMALPEKLKQHLGLDDARSWIVLDEISEFVWPGYDLRPIPGRADRCDYGFLPPQFFDQIAARVRELQASHALISSIRD